MRLTRLFNRTITVLKIFVSLALSLALAGSLSAGSLISYQGHLTTENNLPVSDSSYHIDFLLFNDSAGGELLWLESAEVLTHKGLFTHLLGSINPFDNSIFVKYSEIYLEIWVSGEALSPRSYLSGTITAFTAGNLKGVDTSGSTTIETFENRRALAIYDSLDNEAVLLSPFSGDSGIVLPDASISSVEILNEPGLSVSVNTNLIPLNPGEMQDLVKVTIEIPEDGYIHLTGKCYLLLSGTTGANNAIIQIDEREGGGSNFPYYTIAGLSGYINSGTNYFPINVNRTYYREKGVHTFRLEGRASFNPPALAQSWDHVLNAFYYATSYYGVEEVFSNRQELPFGIDFQMISPDESENRPPSYKIDWEQIKAADSQE